MEYSLRGAADRMRSRQVKADQGGSGIDGDGRKRPAMLGLSRGHGSSSGRADGETGAVQSPRVATASAVVDNAVYVDGRRVEPESLESTYELVRECQGMGWIGLYRPGKSEISSIAQALRSARAGGRGRILEAHQRPKLERYGDTLFVVLRPARYVDSTSRRSRSASCTSSWALRLCRHRPARRGTATCAAVRRRLERRRRAAAARARKRSCTPSWTRVVDDYAPVLAGLAQRHRRDRNRGVRRRRRRSRGGSIELSAAR